MRPAGTQRAATMLREASLAGRRAVAVRYRYRTILTNLASVSTGLILTATVGCTVVKDHSQNLHEPFDAGTAAYDRGHYDVALLDFEARAVAGDPKAQFTCISSSVMIGRIPGNRFGKMKRKP